MTPDCRPICIWYREAGVRSRLANVESRALLQDKKQKQYLGQDERLAKGLSCRDVGIQPVDHKVGIRARCPIVWPHLKGGSADVRATMLLLKILACLGRPATICQDLMRAVQSWEHTPSQSASIGFQACHASQFRHDPQTSSRLARHVVD